MSLQKMFGWLLCLVGIVWLLIALSHARSAAAQTGTPDFTRIDSYIEATMHERGVPGVALAIVHDGSIVHLKSFGKADDNQRAVTPQTPFRIGSATKSFTALAIMQLIEAGKIELNAPVQRYLPWFTLKDAHAAAQITVAQLLHQTSGIPSEALTATIADPLLSLDQFGHSMRDVVPDRPVGSSFAYANANYNLLGLIIEAASGQQYADYVQQHIFTPLDMQHSFATPQSQGHGELAVGYQWFFGVPLATPDRFIPSYLPAGFISASAEDLGHYLIAQMNSGRYGTAQVLSPQGIATLHAPSEHAQTQTNPDMGGTGGTYGMGWVDGLAYGVPAVWHNGDDSRNGSLLVMTKRGWGMAVLINSSHPLSDLEPTEAIVSGATRLLGGLEPVPTGLTSITMIYLVVDSIVIVLSLLILANMLQLPIRQRQLISKWSRVRLGLELLHVVVEIGIAAAIFIGIPRLYFSWQLMLFGVPDLAGWLLGTAIILAITGVIRGVLLVQALLRPYGTSRSAPNDHGLLKQN